MTSTELVVQYAVTALILAGVGLFVLRRLLRRRSRAPLEVGAAIDLLKVRHVRNGGDALTGEASESAGGKLTLGPTALALRWMLGARQSEIAYAAIVGRQLQPFGRSRILLLDVQGEDRFWAIWLHRANADRLSAFLIARVPHA